MRRRQPKELAAILPEITDDIGKALLAYEEISGRNDEAIIFEIDKASRLSLTPTKPNSARSQTAARYVGEYIGDLFVIAFLPKDGTGAEADGRRSLENVYVDIPYPSQAKVVPRDKTGIHTEVHLNILNQYLPELTDEATANPTIFGGNYDLLGIVPGGRGPGRISWLDKVVKIGELGHPYDSQKMMPRIMSPISTYTVGYRQGRSGESERFGDPHAVFSRLPNYLQICAFLAVTDEVAKAHPDLLKQAFSPQEPLPA